MAKMVDITGQRFGRLVALQIEGKKRGATNWKCLCDCGREVIICGATLRNGNTRSCGCLPYKKHGNSTHPLWGVWQGMLQRCDNPRSASYKNYGQRGIKIDVSWEDFKKFVADMFPTYQQGYQLDRIDNNGNYEKENCRWVTPKQNLRNSRNNNLLSYKGVTKCVSEWAEAMGCNYQTLYARLNRGWPVEKILETPIHSKLKRKLICQYTQ